MSANASTSTDTTFYNKRWRPCNRDSAAFFRPAPQPEGNLFVVRDYYISGQLQMEGRMSSLSPEIREGAFTYYDDKGSITGKEQFVRNRGIDTFRYFQHGKRNAERIHNGDTSWVYLKFFDTSTGLLIREGANTNHLESGMWRYYTKGGRLRRTGYYEGGKVHGCMTSFDTTTGIVSVESVYMEDSLVHRNYYTPTGKLFKDAHFRNEKFDGVLRDYDTLTGYIQYLYTYTEDVCSGPFLAYFPNCEHVRFSARLLEGKPNGKSSYFYNCSDRQSLSLSWDFGKLDGSAEIYDKETGRVIASGQFSNDQLAGTWRYYYPDEAKTLRAIKQFNNGLLDSTLVSWWSNGTIRRKETYRSGTLDSWQCFSKEGKDTIYYPYFTPPTFLNEPQYYIDHWAEYPESMRADFVIGKVDVEITVSPDGHIARVKALRSTNSLFEAEALRVCDLIPVLAPGREEDIPAIAKVTYTLTFTPPE